LEAEEGNEDPHAVVSSMFPVNTLPTRVLFDASATHSFINPTTAKQIAHAVEDMSAELCVSTPIGSMYQTDQIVRNCSILGMDWLTTYQATIDCKQKKLTLVNLEGENLIFNGGNSNHFAPLISLLELISCLTRVVLHLCVRLRCWRHQI